MTPAVRRLARDLRVDVTPIAGDEAFAGAVEVLLTDPAVDVGLVGCVPLTGALTTLPEERGEGLAGSEAVAARLGRVWSESDKPWVAVVDAGSLYDPFAARLEELGIPTFRSVDRALRLLGIYARHRRVVDRLRGAEG